MFATTDAVTGIDHIPKLRTQIGRCETCPIRHRAVCSYSDPQQLAALDAIKFYRDFAPGEEIVAERERMSAIGSVVTGVAALRRTLPDGRRQMVGLMLPSDFIGRPGRDNAPYSATAVEPVRMCLFHRREFEAVMRDNRSLERRLLELTLDELDAAREWMVLLGRKTAEEKLATFLMVMLRRRSRTAEVRVPARLHLPLGREAIAEYLGLTIETVSRRFTQLRKDGVVELPDTRTVMVLRPDALVEMSGDDDPAFDIDLPA